MSKAVDACAVGHYRTSFEVAAFSRSCLLARTSSGTPLSLSSSNSIFSSVPAERCAPLTTSTDSCRGCLGVRCAVAYQSPRGASGQRYQSRISWRRLSRNNSAWKREVKAAEPSRGNEGRVTVTHQYGRIAFCPPMSQTFNLKSLCTRDLMLKPCQARRVEQLTHTAVLATYLLACARHFRDGIIIQIQNTPALA